MDLDLRTPWSIRDVEIPTRLVLAPMAGVSVQAFRRQGRRYGAGLVCSEMVSCAGIEHRNEKTLGYLRVAGDEHPLAIQIFGSDPAVMAEAARMVAAAGADIVKGRSRPEKAQFGRVLSIPGHGLSTLSVQWSSTCVHRGRSGTWRSRRDSSSRRWRVSACRPSGGRDGAMEQGWSAPRW